MARFVVVWSRNRRSTAEILLRSPAVENSAVIRDRMSSMPSGLSCSMFPFFDYKIFYNFGLFDNRASSPSDREWRERLRRYTRESTLAK
ncbi:unnamed protein product [Ectocarpus sp. 12 AP-2014]